MLFTLTSKIIKYMTLENQVTSLDLAKRLKELGFKQESAFYYAGSENGELLLCLDNGREEDFIVSYLGDFDEEDSINIPAYTVAELGEMSPEYVGDWFLEMYKDSSNLENDEWFLIRYVSGDEKNDTSHGIKIGFNCKTEADARAKMLIYLKENNLI